MQDPNFKDQTIIIKADIELRAEQIHNVAYSLIVSIPKGKQFSGTQTISFDLKKALEQDVFVDLHGETVESLIINRVGI